jgi:hypothetical protein
VRVSGRCEKTFTIRKLDNSSIDSLSPMRVYLNTVTRVLGRVHIEGGRGPT